MSQSGVERRRRRIEGTGGKILLLAIDHGLPAGPLPGIERPAELVRRLRSVPFSGILANPGLVLPISGDVPPEWGLVVHLSASTPLSSRPGSKVLSSTVEHAISLGADAVSVQICFGDSNENRMIADAGRVVDSGRSLGVPVLMMAYARAAPGESSGDPVAAALAARAAAEIGASIVQTNFAGASDGLRTIVRACPVPVVVAGGPRAPSEEAFLDGLRGMLGAGATGLSVGRQVFQAVDPAAVACRIADTLFGSDPPIEVEAAR